MMKAIHIRNKPAEIPVINAGITALVRMPGAIVVTSVVEVCLLLVVIKFVVTVGLNRVALVTGGDVGGGIIYPVEN